MTWFKRTFGLDPFDVVVHVGATFFLCVFIGMSDGPEELFPVVTGASLIVLGIRRRIALKAMDATGLTSGQMASVRLEEVEQRVADLEAAQTRIVELEERLDFAERLLTRSSGERASLPAGDGR